MALTSRVLASGPGWRAQDVICSAGPRDRTFEEEHDVGCIAIVTAGTFRYRSTVGSAVLAPGALLLGSPCHGFECSHDHSSGDRCLSFKFAPEFLEDVTAAVPGARQTAFGMPRLPPLPGLLPVVAAAEAARDDGDAGELAEIALRLAGAVVTILAGPARRPPAPSRSDERRISAALHRIERDAHEALSLAGLAGVAAMSPYHFLRTFRAVVGMTPHQYILHMRLHRAAVQLRRTADSISAIAFAAGFNDLSTFNRRFARIMGARPSAYRASAAPMSKKGAA
ncbi:MAG: helix-turn-helix transcriptional regulator [Xanthobacteraceae bacterium]